MRRKRFIWCLALAAVVGISVWMLWPRPLAAAFDAEGRFSGIVLTGGVEVENFITRPTMEAEEYTIAADSPEGAAVGEILERYSYHLCLDSLTGKSALEGIGKTAVYLYGGETRLNVFSGTGKLFCNGRIVRLGYWGNQDAAALCEELAAALEAGNAG